ncbi:peroxidase-like [Amphibalanus amphitrite]|uniref:peroxidase-like n=1 Tax=Amphibalanus amphitrite TaxID=1232801 RepID=UPI001C924936|nr:peroxidase-like [Amphibalanus amphitrite]
MLPISVLVRGGVGLFNLRPLLGNEFPRPPLGDIDPPADLTFRGDLLGDVVSTATDEMDSLRTREAPQGFQNQSRTGAAYPSRLHGMHRKPLEEVLNDSYFARTAIRATQLLQKRLALSGAEVAFRLPLYDLAATRLGRVCPPHHGARYPACDSAARYRTADGTCNNLQFSWWGSARSAFVRLLPPDYGDKVDSPRAAADGSALPSARRVSAACLSQPLVVSELSERISLMVMQWGQFLDHDLSHTPMSTATLYGRPVSCCGLSDPGQHPDCYPISVPRGDSLYREHGQTCMEFARSVPALHNGCGLGPREQVNQVTSYIDGSVVYGSSDAEMSRLRQFEGGRMKTEDSRLPTTEDEGGCIRQRRDVRCFQSGDIRVNEQPDLTTLHTLWLREHNRVAGRLQRYCPAWDDETLFQESRRLVAAMLQHVTYREWVPLVVGPRLAARHGLQPLQEGYFSDYSPDVDATIANVFATGAMRFGHTLVPDHLMLFTPWHTKLAGVALHKNFFRPHSLYHPGRIDEYMAGLANANSSEADNYLVDTIRNRLFAPPGAAFGLDLGALNIQRGRDHGLPSYVQWRRACRLTPVDSFAQLKTVMSPLAVAKLITTYKDLADVDLYVGGLLETPLEGALVGPTLACLMANQFQTLRRGDRFWYENGDERHSFTPAQLRELRKVTLSKVICDNSALATIQPDIMFKPDDTSNQRVKCRHLPALDLRLWASELGCVAPQRPQTGSGGRPGPARPPPFWPGGRPAGGPTPFPGGPPPAGSTPPPTRPAAGTDDSLERPVFPGSEPTEPVTPTGAGPSTGPATSDGQPPSWEPQPPSRAPAVEPPAQVVPVDPAVLPPSEPTPSPAVVPVDPAVWPPSRPTPGPAPLPEIAVDPPRTTTPRPTPGPAVIPVDPPVLPPAAG